MIDQKAVRYLGLMIVAADRSMARSLVQAAKQLAKSKKGEPVIKLYLLAMAVEDALRSTTVDRDTADAARLLAQAAAGDAKPSSSRSRAAKERESG